MLLLSHQVTDIDRNLSFEVLERHAQTSHYNVLIQVTACEQAVAKMKSDIHCKSKMRSEELSR